MADQKLTALTEATTVTTDDLLYVVDDPAGSPASKKMAYSVIQDNIDAAEQAATSDLNAHVDAEAGSSGAHTSFLSLVASDWKSPPGYTPTAVGAWEVVDDTGVELRITDDDAGNPLDGRSVSLRQFIFLSASIDSGGSATTVPENDPTLTAP